MVVNHQDFYHLFNRHNQLGYLASPQLGERKRQGRGKAEVIT
ncbi:hypothetical protein CPter91_4182 [Collimonas pratensis]|uniref:Uncharacterized protein n=1 Tax=Collimonas pratensis TaxID=279113 RepID=A0A127Q8W3_9BURK|nr:hypothetical protein CPter91_4182 [Collimonas pratensis]